MLGVTAVRWHVPAAGEPKQPRAPTLAVRAVRLSVLVLIASCGLDDPALESGRAARRPPAACVGSWSARGLRAALNFLGATLLLLAAWMAGLSLAFGVSWLTIMDRIGAAVWRWSSLRWLRSGRARRA